MDKSAFPITARAALPSWRLHHPQPRGQRTMEVRSLQSQGLASAAIWRLCSMSHTTFSRYRHASRVGGIEALKEVPFPQQQSQWAAYRTRIAADVRQRPPARVAEAAARMADLTGLQRGPPQGRQFLQSLGMTPRKVGQMPANVDVAAQEACTIAPREPRLAEANAGQRVVVFEAAPVMRAIKGGRRAA